MDNAEIPQIGMRTLTRLARARQDKTFIEMAMEMAQKHGPIFQLPGSGARKIMVSSFALMDELCDDQRFDKALGQGLQDVRAIAGDGLFTSWTAEPNWHKAHNILLPPSADRL
jgi:cytochrome P450/NADPH-cytochrome P450 reductase